MQISTAIDSTTVAVTNGQNRVIASATANWAGVSTGDIFTLVGSILYYQVANVYEPGHAGNTTSDRWELVIVGVINEASNAAAAYVIAVDFTPILNLWDPQLRDTQIQQLLKRNFWILDNQIGQIGGSFQKATIGAAGNTNSNQAKAIHSIRLTIQTGSGAYIATLSLPRGGRATGDRCNIKFDLSSAAVNPTLRIFDNTTAGTQLFEWIHDGLVKAIQAVCVLDDTGAWYLEAANFMQ
jgi:hypothetical protein